MPGRRRSEEEREGGRLGHGRFDGRRDGGELGDRGYEREFYGANEGRGAGAGARRYPEVRHGYLGGEAQGAGSEYGGAREDRDYLGAPRDSRNTQGSQGSDIGQRFDPEQSAGERWRDERVDYGAESGEFARSAPSEEARYGGGHFGSDPHGSDWRSRAGQQGQPGGWSPDGRGSASRSGEARARFGFHAPWELGPTEERHYPAGSWPDSGFRGQAPRYPGAGGAGGDIGRAAHYGRGPKGYTRSDDRLNEEIHERLMRDGWIDASDVEVRVESGVVTLGGSVSDRRVKHRIEDLVADVMGVKDVTNQIRVSREDRSNGHSSSDGDKGDTVR